MMPTNRVLKAFYKFCTTSVHQLQLDDILFFCKLLFVSSRISFNTQQNFRADCFELQVVSSIIYIIISLFSRNTTAAFVLSLLCIILPSLPVIHTTEIGQGQETADTQHRVRVVEKNLWKENIKNSHDNDKGCRRRLQRTTELMHTVQMQRNSIILLHGVRLISGRHASEKKTNAIKNQDHFPSYARHFCARS